MADSKITALAALTTADPANDMFPVVDVSDTSMAASGTTKRISINNLLACSPSATLASATITGAATIGTTLGVTGVSTFAAGTALLPALTTTGDTNTGIYYPAADTFAVTTGGTERYRIDASGNVGIGVTPSAWAAGGNIQGTNGFIWSSYDASIGAGYYYASSSYKYISTAAASIYSPFGGTHKWFTGAGGQPAGTNFTPTQAMTLDASGSLLIGTTSATIGATAAKLHLSADGTDRWAVGPQTNSGNFIIQASSTYGVYLAGLTATSWVSASDERLKDVIEPISNAVSKVGSLRAVIGKFKSDKTNTRKPFLMAQDVLAVLPEAVDVSKPDQFGLAYTDVIPLLVAAIKELSAEVNALKNA